MKQWLFPLVSGLALALSFPRLNLAFLSWLAFVPLFFALQKKSLPKAFFISYLSGLIFWLGTIYWLAEVTVLGMLLLAAYLALYFGFFGLVFRFAWRGGSYFSQFFLASVWVILEFIRSHLFSGFPWALLGYTQYLNLPLIQIADITGSWGVSFLVILVNIGIYNFLSSGSLHNFGKKIKLLLPALLVFILGASYGIYALHFRTRASYAPILTISLIQGNIPQEIKWAPFAKDFIINKYLRLSASAAKEGPDLIIWPEAAVPAVLEEEPFYQGKLSAFTRRIKIPIMFGAVTSKGGLYYNSAILYSREGLELLRYNKLHLVPFGEYIPLRKALGFLQTLVPIGDIEAGGDYTVFSLKDRQGLSGMRFSVLICFEDLFPGLSRNFIKRGAQFLVNITNDAWFGKSSSPFQHLQASVLRAVENRAYVLRAANTGISGFIAPSGEILSLVKDNRGNNIFVDGLVTQKILLKEKGYSFYTLFGDWFILALFLLSLYGISGLILYKH